MSLRIADEASLTDVGRQRHTNEDSYFADAPVFAVADGMGGAQAGEVASAMAVEEFRNGHDDSLSPEEQLEDLARAANRRIWEMSQNDQQRAGMGTTLTAVMVGESEVSVGHVGDSRLYLLWDGAIRKLTSDHSPVGEDEDAGALSEEEAMLHPRRHEVFRDVGSRLLEVDDEVFVEIRQCRFRDDAALLLCSDGLTDHLTAARIRAITARYAGDPARVAAELVDAANDAGGSDNITALFVAGPQFSGRGGATRPLFEPTTRRSPRRRRFRGRLAFLIYGALIGMLIWLVLRP